MYSWQYPNILALAWTKKYVIVLAIIDIFTLQDLTKNKNKKISILILIATLGRLISDKSKKNLMQKLILLR